MGEAALNLATVEEKRSLIRLANAALEDARHDPASFCEYVLRHSKFNTRIHMSPMHEEWHRLITDNDRVLIVAHVEAGKSQNLSIGRTLFELGTDPNRSCAVISETDEKAVDIVGAIREYILKSEALHEVFPHLKPAIGLPWTQHKIFVERSTTSQDPSVQVYGAFSGKIGGKRIDRMCFDDVLGFNNTTSLSEMKKVENWCNSADVVGRLTDRAKVWMTGNAWHVDDMYHHLRKDPTWVVAAYPVMNERTGELYFPDVWYLERIQRKKDELDRKNSFEFGRQMLCLARSDESSRFKRAWIDRCLQRGDGFEFTQRMEFIPNGYRTITGVDLATGRHRGRGDRTAIVTIIVHPNEHKEILMIESGRWQAPEIVERIIDTHNRYHSQQILVENNGQQEFLLQVTRKISNVPVQPYTTSKRTFKDPFLGIDAMATEFKNGYWILPNTDGYKHPELAELLKDLVNYDPDLHAPDRVMALFFAFEGARITKRKGVIRPLDLTTR